MAVSIVSGVLCATAARPRVAVLLSGAFVHPNVETTWPTLRTHVFEPHNASAFVFLTPDNVRLASDLHPRHDNFLITRRGNTNASKHTICNAVLRLMQRPWLARCRVEPDEVGVQSLPNGMRDKVWARSVAQFVKVCGANRLRLEHEAQTGEIFGLIVRLRFDLWFHHSLSLPFWPAARPSPAPLARRHGEPHNVAPILTTEPIAWVITDLLLDCTSCGRSKRPHALDHLFALSHAAANTICAFSAALELWWRRGIPATCGPAWFPEGQLLRHLWRHASVRLLPIHREPEREHDLTTDHRGRTSDHPHVHASSQALFSFDSPRVSGTMDDISLVQKSWACAARKRCTAYRNVTGQPEGTQIAETILHAFGLPSLVGTSPRAKAAANPDVYWTIEDPGCLRGHARQAGLRPTQEHAPALSSNLNLSLREVLLRNFDTKMLRDCATRGYC